VAARFPGPLRSVHARVGDRVRAGQVLARVESNLSLSDYAITAPISGVVLSRNAAEGDVASEGRVLFEVADLSTLWVDLHVFGADASHIGVGSPVLVTRLGDGVSAQSEIERILPATATASQSTVARAVLANADGLWRPGTAVRARITVDRAQVPLVVPLTALQEVDGREVVFVRVGETYAARAVTLGRRDARSVEVLSGLRAGEQVVVQQSYVIKADLEKSGAAHEH
jgi:cobalt-zinc-cadmium efflux system membrane fusion protein